MTIPIEDKYSLVHKLLVRRGYATQNPNGWITYDKAFIHDDGNTLFLHVMSEEEHSIAKQKFHELRHLFSPVPYVEVKERILSPYQVAMGAFK